MPYTVQEKRPTLEIWGLSWLLLYENFFGHHRGYSYRINKYAFRMFWVLLYSRRKMHGKQAKSIKGVRMLSLNRWPVVSSIMCPNYLTTLKYHVTWHSSEQSVATNLLTSGPTLKDLLFFLSVLCVCLKTDYFSHMWTKLRTTFMVD